MDDSLSFLSLALLQRWMRDELWFLILSDQIWHDTTHLRDVDLGGGSEMMASGSAVFVFMLLGWRPLLLDWSQQHLDKCATCV